MSEASATETSAVELASVRHHLGGNLVIDDLSMNIPTGTIFGLIGPNGSGKTTTMRLILRIYQPDQGDVRVFGETSGRADQLRIGYLPEERGLYPRMTVEKTLMFFARLRGVEDPKQEMTRWLERLGVSDWSKKKVEQLSKGMGQKIQFIAAVMGSPRLVILDEPFSGLDPVNLDLLREAVLQLRNEGTTVILSTHDMAVAQGMCDRVGMICRGSKVLDGKIDDIRREYGGPRLKVRLAGKSSVADAVDSIEGVHVQRQADESGFSEVVLSDLSQRAMLLSRLTDHGEVEHFETVQPSLHDIFVQIAGPEATQNPSALDTSALDTSPLS